MPVDIYEYFCFSFFGRKGAFILKIQKNDEANAGFCDADLHTYFSEYSVWSVQLCAGHNWIK
jgi:hypothetical protein